MSEESLNLNNAILKLTLKALSISENKTDAASKLGINRKTLAAYIIDNNIKFAQSVWIIKK